MSFLPVPFGEYARKYPLAQVVKGHGGLWNWSVRVDLIPVPHPVPLVGERCGPLTGWAWEHRDARVALMVALEKGLGEPGVAEHILLGYGGSQ